MWGYCKDAAESISDEESNFIELSIVGLHIMRMRKFLAFDRVRTLLKNRRVAGETLAAKLSNDPKNGKQHVGEILAKIKFFFQQECQTWDFCLLSKSLHKNFIKNFIKKIEKQKERQIFVMVGHPKSLLSNGRNLDWLLRVLRNKGYVFSIIKDVKL